MDVVNDDDYAEIVHTVRSAMLDGGVYIHCWGGIGRTATAVGCLLVDGGLDADAALARIDGWRSLTRKSHMRAPQTQAQVEAVGRFAATRSASS